MNSFIQHIPSFVDIDERPKEIPFNTTGDLLNIDVVKQFANQDEGSWFAIKGKCLMHISDNGFHWWVVGYIKNPMAVDLPAWDGWKFRAKLNDGTVTELSGQDVISVCGDLLTLRDGTTAQNIRKPILTKNLVDLLPLLAMDA